ncbi:helix-turn-helix domain-containing protein [[Brevibacterium] frigoritolerans]|nr:helix-turn-helix domain-containing protein [Peribacillus frigoritolerans]
MIVRLRGEFNQDEFIQNISNVINEYVGDTHTVKGSLYLNLFDENGEEVDYFKNGKSLELVIQSKRKKKKLNSEDILKIKELLEKGQTAKEIADLLNTSSQSVGKMKKEIEDSDGLELPFIPKDEMNEYMFFEYEFSGMKEIDERLKMIGVAKTELGSIEKVYSIEPFCSQNNISYYGKYFEEPFVTKEAFSNRSNIKFSGLEEGIGFVRDHRIFVLSGEFTLIYDLRRVLEENGFKYFSDEDDLPNGLCSELKLKKGKVPENTYLDKEIGFYLGYIGNGLKLIGVYEQEKILSAANLRLVDDEELRRDFGKKLFNINNLGNYIPKTYGVRTILEPYGIDKDGNGIYRTIKPLYEFFGLIENIEKSDFLVDPFKMSKLKIELKKNNTPLNEIMPDGMTEDYLLVYKKGKIPEEIKDKYSLFLAKKELEENFKKESEK